MRDLTGWIFGLAAVLSLLAMPAAAQAPTEEDEYCGWSYPVDTYLASINGLDIRLTANDRLVVNGKVIAERDPQPWRNSVNTAQLAVAGDEVLILTNNTDCIDGSKSALYIVRKDGTLRVSTPLWSEHHRYGLVREGGGLIYWSDWFCDPSNKERKPRMAYVYSLAKDATEFVKEDRRADSLCSESAVTDLRVNSLHFGGMMPWSHELAAVRP
jgi:hypothetical protein